jgi:hypothetical protein
MGHENATMKPTLRTLLLISGVALALRLAIYFSYSAPLIGDAREYYYNSQTLENTVRQFPYEHWYQRSPAYMAFLHLTAQSLLLQIVLSALTCVLLELLYPYAGWVYAFYPPGIMYANVYMKETLLIFLFVLAVYLLRKHTWWLLLVLPLIFAGFVSYGGVWEYNSAFAAGQRSFIHRLYILWRPEWHFTILVPTPPEWLELLLRGSFILFFLPLIVIFIRRVKFTDFEFWLVTGFSLIAIFSFGNERFREPVMPFVIGYVTPIAVDMVRRLREMLTAERKPT